MLYDELTLHTPEIWKARVDLDAWLYSEMPTEKDSMRYSIG